MVTTCGRTTLILNHTPIITGAAHTDAHTTGITGIEFTTATTVIITTIKSTAETTTPRSITADCEMLLL
jgi:hypothetical protein